MFKRNNKSADEREHYARQEVAAKPADIQIGMLMPEAKEVIHEYLMAIFTMNTYRLPMKKMGEGIYNFIGNSIIVESQKGYARKVHHLEILEISPLDFENEFTHVSHIDYEVVYEIKGIQQAEAYDIPFSFNRTAVYRFSFDQRLGWILTECSLDTESREYS